MNFNSLPNQTLQRVVDLCHEADESYKKRMRVYLESATEEEKDDLNPWRGRSCSAMSMVNKTLRSLSAKYIFTTLRMSKIQAPIFQYYIVHSPLAKSFTRLLFDLSGSPSDMPAFAVFSHLAGLLPNISILEGLTTATLRSTCGLYGLVTVPMYRLGPDSPSDIDLVFHQNRNLLLKLANRSTDLDVAIDATQLGLLLGSNYGRTRKLGITSSWTRQRSILGSSDTKFPAVLDQCPDLETLSLRQFNTGGSDDEEEDDDDDADPIHDSVLEVPYSFADNLRSLVLDFPHSAHPISLNELRFAALFPSLEHFKIALRTPLDPAPPDRILLPSLTKLEIGQAYSTSSVIALLRHLVLPSISSIHTITPSFLRFFSYSNATARTEAEAFGLALLPFRPHLKSVNVLAGDDEAPIALLILFVLLEESVAINFNSKPLHEDSRRLSVQQSWKQYNDDNKVDKSRSLTQRFSTPVIAYARSKRVLRWALDYVEKTQYTDWIGARNLLETLKPVEEFMEWMKE